MELDQSQSPLALDTYNFGYINIDVQRKFDFFCGYLQGDKTDVDSAAADAVAAINDPDSEILKTHEGGFSGFLWNFWIVVINLAQQIPHDHPHQGKLVRLLAAIKRLPRPTRLEATEMERNTGCQFWVTLPIFGIQVRERWNEGPWIKHEGDHPSNLGDGPLPPDQWTNLNAFLARLVASSVESFDYYPTRILRHCLEEKRKLVDLEANLPAAAMWIIHAGAWLFRNSVLPRVDDITPQYEADREVLRRFPTMFSRARWDFWKEQLVSMRHEVSLKPGTRYCVERAIERMTELEARGPDNGQDETYA